MGHIPNCTDFVTLVKCYVLRESTSVNISESVNQNNKPNFGAVEKFMLRSHVNRSQSTTPSRGTEHVFQAGTRFDSLHFTGNTAPKTEPQNI